MYRYFEINQKEQNIRCKIYSWDLKNIQRIVIFGHGFGGHRDNTAAEKFAERMLSKYKDCALLTFNWPSHGDDAKNTLHLDDCMKYLSLVILYVQRTFQVDELYSYATSFGGYLMLKYIQEQENPFRKIALRCPAVNMYDVLTTAIISADELARLNSGSSVPVGFDRKIMVSPEFLKELKENDIQQLNYQKYAEHIMILHGTDDEIVPFEAGHSFADKNQISFITVNHADHRFQDEQKMELAINQILGFFAL